MSPGEESGQAYITISSDGANEIHTYFGANLAIEGKHMKDRERFELMIKSKYFVITDPQLEASEVLASICQSNGVKVIWDPGVHSERSMNELLPLLKKNDYIVLNTLEYENLLGTSQPRELTN
jgi:sugar/nucleoside kinase (ribokinase family)